ncbi:cytochrome P450 [Xylariales sp. PMI_506]|nr:cytochrome P450 [Xylariales sp. PMI_506]
MANLFSWPSVNSFNPLVSVSVAVLCGFLYLAYRLALPRPLPGIPYSEDAAKSLLGSLPEIVSFSMEHGLVLPWFPLQNAKYNSPLYQFWEMPLAQPSVIVMDFQETQDILTRRTKEFDHGKRWTDAFVGVMPDHHISMMSSDPRFKRNKEIIRDLMSPTFLHTTSVPEVYDKAMALIRLWSFKAKYSNGKPFSAEHDISDVAMDIVSAAAFAFDDSMSGTKHQLDYLSSVVDFVPNMASDGSVEFPLSPDLAELKTFAKVVKYAGQVTGSPLPRVVHYWTWLTNSDIRRSTAQKDRVIAKEIQKSVKKMEDPNNDRILRSAVDNILRRERTVAVKENRQTNFFSGRIQDEIFGYIMAGYETSLAGISWSVKLLSDHQEMQHKLRSSLRTSYIEAVAESRQPSPDEIVKRNIPYLDAVIEECFRVGNPIRVFHREATVDTTVLGRRIPKGTTLLFPSTGPGFTEPPIPVDDSLRSETSRSQYRGRHWDPSDCGQFNPNRWLTKDGDGNLKFDSQSGPFLSFGQGPRGCFGRKLAYQELRMIVVLLVWNFHLKELDGKIQSHDIVEGVSSVPKYTYVALEELH